MNVGYLTAPELSSLIGCRENSFACMRRWLSKNGWPYATTITGFPKVSREYHDNRMSGIAPESIPDHDAIEPDFSMFQT